MTASYIIDTVRTPRGRGKAGTGALSHVHPQELLAQVLQALQARNHLDPARVDDVIIGAVSQIGEQGANIARNAVLAAGCDALGIESADNRSRDQLHIHISRLIPDARKDIDKQWKAIATDESKWKDSVITVLGKKFRAWNVATLNHNLFKHLNDDIVTPFKVQMRNQTMLVTGCAPNTCNGLIVLNSDKVSPNTNPGANNIEFLLDKG